MNNLKILLALAALLLAGCSGPPDENNPDDTEYTLSVSSTGGGSVTRKPSKETYKYGDTVIVIAKARTGYEFDVWSGASTDTTDSVTIRITKNERLTANFRLKRTDCAANPYAPGCPLADTCAANPYTPGCPPAYALFTIIFDANGGTVTPDSGGAGADSTLAFLPFPDERDGYTFNGWFTAESGGDKVTTDTKFRADDTIYAQWVSGAVPTYTVKFDANGGAVMPESGKTDASGTLSSLPALSKTGYTFDGWFTEKNGGAEVTTSTVFTDDTTIYAQWTFNIYRVTFDLQYGGVADSQDVEHGGKAAEPADAVRGNGYTFGGWYNEPQCVTAWDFDEDIVTSDTTLYARWTLKTYKITFDANGGRVTPESGATGEGFKLGSLPRPTKEKYIFKGWYTAETDGDSVELGDTYGADVTIYARWELDTAKIFIDSRDNTIYRKVEINNQTWMAENLNYGTDGSLCYENSADSCAKYGRLYSWNAATEACPADWHLPSDEEWTTLANYAGGDRNAGMKLKSTSGWNNNGNGSDDYDFSALPGGYHNGNTFIDAAYSGYWWSSSELSAYDVAYYRHMSYGGYAYWYYYYKHYLFSVRCVLDN